MPTLILINIVIKLGTNKQKPSLTTYGMITLGTALDVQCFIVKLIVLDIIHISLTDKKFQCALSIPFLCQVLIQQSLKVWHGGVGEQLRYFPCNLFHATAAVLSDGCNFQLVASVPLCTGVSSPSGQMTGCV